MSEDHLRAQTPRAGAHGTAEYVFEQFRVERGCLGYVISDPRTGLVAIVDPETEMVGPMLDYVYERKLKPQYVIDTHTHADHVSGSSDLKSKTVARLVMHEKAPARTVDLRVQDGDRLYLGDLSIKFLYTPGHAKDLVSLQLADRLLTGDALLIGSCGRTDLLNGNPIQQYHTLYHTFRSLPDGLLVYPGHDYRGRVYTTLGQEKRSNPKMCFATEEEFVEYMSVVNPQKLDPVYQLAKSLKANME